MRTGIAKFVHWLVRYVALAFFKVLHTRRRSLLPLVKGSCSLSHTTACFLFSFLRHFALSRYYDTLSPAEQAKLVAQLEEINPHEVLDRYARTTAKSKEEMSGGIEACVPTRSDLASPEDLAKWEKVGFEAISKGQIGVIVLAGGQGTRLGFHLPKGCFPGGDSELLSAWLPSGKTLFALQAERILRLQALAAEKTGATNPLIQWYVMTSPQTHADTEENLMNNNFYGLNPTQVHLFQQGTLPCIADDGNKFIMASPSEVCLSG